MSTSQDTTNGAERTGDCPHCQGVMHFTWQPGGDATLECERCHHAESVSALLAEVMRRKPRNIYRRRLMAESIAVCRTLLDQQAVNHDERREGIVIALLSITDACGSRDVTTLRGLIEEAA